MSELDDARKEYKKTSEAFTEALNKVWEASKKGPDEYKKASDEEVTARAAFELAKNKLNMLVWGNVKPIRTSR